MVSTQRGLQRGHFHNCRGSVFPVQREFLELNIQIFYLKVTFNLSKMLNWEIFPEKLWNLSNPPPYESCYCPKMRIPFPSFTGSTVVSKSSISCCFPWNQTRMFAYSLLSSNPLRTIQQWAHLSIIIEIISFKYLFVLLPNLKWFITQIETILKSSWSTETKYKFTWCMV